MKIKAWVPREVEIPDHLVEGLRAKVRARFGLADQAEVSDTDLLEQAGMEGVIDTLPFGSEADSDR